MFTAPVRSFRPFLLALLLSQIPLHAQQQELGLTLGRISGPGRTLADPLRGSLEQGSGVALQANYGYRIVRSSLANLYIQVHFLANGQRTIAAPIRTASTDIATLYLTPGLRLRFFPESRLSPWAEIGGGYALYEQSLLRADGQPNDSGRFLHRGAISFGGGIDVPLWRFVGLRLEARDFYTGNPGFNLPVRSSGQHNVVIGGGFTLRFGE